MRQIGLSVLLFQGLWAAELDLGVSLSLTKAVNTNHIYSQETQLNYNLHTHLMYKNWLYFNLGHGLAYENFGYNWSFPTSSGSTSISLLTLSPLIMQFKWNEFSLFGAPEIHRIMSYTNPPEDFKQQGVFNKYLYRVGYDWGLGYRYHKNQFKLTFSGREAYWRVDGMGSQIFFNGVAFGWSYLFF